MSDPNTTQPDPSGPDTGAPSTDDPTSAPTAPDGTPVENPSGLSPRA